uniref:Uncharacterized protein n=1 Tax=Avena sativa TaxID=4498 RepID=A0ACD6AJX7_AVESA
MDASADSPSVAALLSRRSLSIRTPRAPAAGADDSAAEEEPVTPNARLMESIYIVISMGLGSPLNMAVFSAALDAIVVRFPRFQSIQVTDGSKDGNPRWVQVTVNVHDHIIVPTLDPAAVEADPDQAMEDYTASLLTLPMDRSRPLWEFHFLDFPTSEASSTVLIRVHHSLGDGVSLITLLLASSRSAADPTRLPAMPKQPARAGAIYEPPARSSGAGALLAWAWSYFLLAWNTAVDVAFFAATIIFLRDPDSLFRGEDDGMVHRSRRFVHRSLSLDDVKFIKNAMNCTVNDVLVGVTSAALSRYYFRNSGDTNAKKICLRSLLPVNIRPALGLQTYVNMIESGKSSKVVWGNQLGYILLPLHLAMQYDPLAYVHKAKKTMDRKKSSLEVLCTYKTAEFFLKKFGLKAGSLISRGMLGNTTMTLSTMIGPAEKIEFCGHQVAFIAPSVYGIPQALIVHYQSYNSTIKVILSVDDEIFPDYGELLDDFSESFVQIKDAASRLSKSIKKK